MREDRTFRSRRKEAQSGYCQVVSKAGEERARSREASEDTLRNRTLSSWASGVTVKAVAGKQRIEKTVSQKQKESKRELRT